VAATFLLAEPLLHAMALRLAADSGQQRGPDILICAALPKQGAEISLRIVQQTGPESAF
jgi:hypothetical protein